MKNKMPAREEIVRRLQEAGRPLTAREIKAAFSLRPEQDLGGVLEAMVTRGLLKRLGGHRYAPAAIGRGGGDATLGKLSMNPRGFGFVTAPGSEDVYIAPESVGAAFHGDRVEVEVVGRSTRGVEGRIVRIVERRNSRIAGLLRRRGKSVWLEPDDSRIRGPIVVSGNAKIGKDGEAAVVNVTRFPEFSDENAEGELVSVLGTPGEPNVEVAKILVREGVEEQHSDGAVREAESLAARTLRDVPTTRRDLREVPLPTIDPEDARDHDDAIWVERNGEGYRAYIAIADVSESVEEGSALDVEARARGCTIYLPDRAIPMLPSALAADLCSLLPDRDRLCVCVIVELDVNASIKSYEIVEGVMRSAAMLTYGGVARALGFTDEPPRSAQAEAMKKDLKVLDELSRKLRRGRMARGALDLDLPEPKLILDPKTGAPLDVKRRTQDPGIKRAYSMVEELMLLANEVVAQWLGERRSSAVYRIHGKPDEAKLERLSGIADKLGVELDLDALQTASGVSRWLAKIQKHPRRQVLEMLLLRSLKQATYDTKNLGHFGLASEAYVHFTSPIRRYPDILVHRAVKHLLRGNKPKNAPDALEALAEAAQLSSERERAAMEIEREVVDLYRALLMRERVGDVLEGSVTALVGSGVFVALDDPFVEVLVRFEAMGPDRYELSEDELSVVGSRSGDTIALGDRMVVVIEDVAILRRTVYARRVVPEAVLEMVSEAAPPARGRKKVVQIEARPGRFGERRGLKVHAERPHGGRGTARKNSRPARAEGGRKPPKRGRRR
ncbi:MAG: ribonuclease R family protein [Myxococcota bacterium]